MMKALRRTILGALGATAITAAGAPVALAQSASPTLDSIRARGQLICGVNTGLAGFGRPDAQGVWRGFDVEYCRAVAIAIFNDANRVRFVPLTAQQRFPAIQSGEVDVLIRNTTWTLTRDVSLGLDFTGINFYDGQGFMVKASLGVRRASELGGATICVQPGTTTERNLTDWARANRVQFRPVVIERLEEIVQAYLAGRCDAYTTDVSGLAATRSTQPNPAEHVILPDVISKEPLGPSVRHGDQRFADLVRWVHFGLLTAEELGITAANVAQAATGDERPAAQRLLGRTGGLGQMLGVEDAFMRNIIASVGNYGEIFERNLGPLGLQRGPNALWTQGGLQYAPPFQ